MIGSIIQLLSTFVKWADAWWTKSEQRKNRNQRRQEIDEVAKTTEQIKQEVNQAEETNDSTSNSTTDSVADLNNRFGWTPKT